MLDMRNKTCSCCGMIWIQQTCLHLFVGCIYKRLMTFIYPNFYSKRHEFIWMVNSFWGLDKPRLLPPNIHLTGPLTKSTAPYMELLKQKDIDLYNWLEDAVAKEEDVVVITLGSICKWQQWSINAVYKGLKNIGCRVVWSLAEEYQAILSENPKDNPKFFVSKWIPQIEVLHHRAIKAGMTHCGWGGVLEFIGAGVPIVSFPHFIDQPINSKLLVDAKAAVLLY